MNMIKKWIRKIARQVLDEERDSMMEEVLKEIEIPDASEIAQEIDLQDLGDMFDASEIAYSMDASDVAQYMSAGDVAEYIDVDASDVEVDYDDLASCIDTDNIDIDVSDIEVDYGELSAHVAEDLDLEEIARHADVDKVIFSHMHILQRRIEALIAIVSESAQNTLDLMVFNKALEGEEE
jgi:hypothetical protein